MKQSISILLLVILAGFGLHLNAEKKGVAIDKKMVEGFAKNLKLTPAEKSLMNALKNKQFKSLFVNREVFRDHNNKYTYEIKTGVITNQKSTGRCWLYAGLNAVRPGVVKKLNMKDFEFSLSHLFFWDKMEKANFFLEKAIKRSKLDIRSVDYQRMLSGPLGDGGYWQNFVDLIKKYGCAPKSAMPELASNKSSSQMVRNKTWYLKTCAYEIRELKKKGKKEKYLRNKKKEYLANIYRMLVMHLGEPVKSFNFRYYTKDKKGKKSLTPYKTYTPMAFAKEFIAEDVDDYVMFANWPAREYNKFYEWESSNNCIEGIRLNFINLPINDIKSMMVDSLKAGVAVNFSADVGKQSMRTNGIMHPDIFRYQDVYGVNFKLGDKKMNSLVRNVNSTHAMVFLGVDIQDGKPLKWKVENSWSTKSGDRGFYAMYDKWLDRYVVRVVIHKKFVPAKVLKLLKTKAYVIPESEPEQ